MLHSSGTPLQRNVWLKNGDLVAVETVIVQPTTRRRIDLCDECRDELVTRVELSPVTTW